MTTKKPVKSVKGARPSVVANSASIKTVESAPFSLVHSDPTNPEPVTISNIVVDDSLTEPERKYGLELQAKFPDVVRAASAVADQEQAMARKYFNLADSLRRTGLNGREMSLLMASLGYRKQRITEIKKAISVSDDVWEKYKANVIGFRAVLAIARAPAPETPAQSEDSSSDGAADGPTQEKKSGGRKTEVKSISPSVMSMLSDVLAQAVEADSLPHLESGYYQMSYDITISPKDENGVATVRRLLLSIETGIVSPAAK